MEEIARVVASSPTMDGAAVTLGYKNANTLSVLIAMRHDLKETVRRARQKAGRPTYEWKRLNA
jgi:hypothetical protein